VKNQLELRKENLVETNSLPVSWGISVFFGEISGYLMLFDAIFAEFYQCRFSAVSPIHKVQGFPSAETCSEGLLPPGPDLLELQSLTVSGLLWPPQTPQVDYST
jgi:hypothetical protein